MSDADSRQESLKSPASGTEQKVLDSDATLPLLVIAHGENQAGKRSSFRRRIMWLLATMVIAGCVLAGAFQSRFATPRAAPEADPILVDPGVASRVFALGRLEPEGEVISVSAPSGAGDARVDTLNVREGDTVCCGDILAVLDSEDRLQAAVQVAKESAEQARLRIARTQLEVETSRTQLEAALQAAESRLATARLRLTRSQKLYQASAGTEEDREQRELELRTGEDAVLEARARLQRYHSASGEELIDVALSRQEYATAKATLDQAIAQLEQAWVRAPTDGAILRLNVRPGERIGQTPLLDMGATHDMRARVEVYESDVPRLRVGQNVRLTASPLASPLTGTVERIMNLVRRQEIVNSIPAANTDARVVEVWVRLEKASSEAAARFVNLQVRAEFLP